MTFYTRAELFRKSWTSAFHEVSVRVTSFAGEAAAWSYHELDSIKLDPIRISGSEQGISKQMIIHPVSILLHFLLTS